MRLGVDADPIGRSGSGNETYLRGIIGGLQRRMAANDSLVLFGSELEALLPLRAANTEVVPSRPGLSGDLLLGRAMRRAGAEVALGHYNAPVGFGSTVATVVHDVSFLRFPATFPTALRWRIRASVWRSTAVSTLIVTSSEFSRAELLECYGRLRPDQVVVTPNAPAAVFAVERQADEVAEVRSRYELPEQFVLAVGNIQPRKNFARAAQAVAALDVPFVVVGQPLWKHDQVLQQSETASVRWLGRVSNDDLACIYRLCTVFLYPSLYEGFGLPVVEAMASGAPVVTSCTTSLAEVAGAAALQVDPLSVDAIRDAVGSLLDDGEARRALAVRGRQRAAQFSWDDSAQRLLDALERVTG